jgi:phage-related baseplate assembly protein
VSTSTGSNLDNIGELIGLVRNGQSASVTRFEFKLNPGYISAVIPSGTAISSPSGNIVYTIDDTINVVEAVDGIMIIADATCTQEGANTNGHPKGTINLLQNPLIFVHAVANIDITSGGADIETDESFKGRWSASLPAIGAGGSVSRYKAIALGVNNTIVDVAVLGANDGAAPGHIKIYTLTNNGAPSQAIVDLVAIACKDDAVRMVNDRIESYPAILVPFALVINIIGLAKASNLGTIVQQVKDAVTSYATGLKKKLGIDVVGSAIIKAGMVDGVKRLELVGWTDISISATKFAAMSTIIVNLTSTEEP